MMSHWGWPLVIGQIIYDWTAGAPQKGLTQYDLPVPGTSVTQVRPATGHTLTHLLTFPSNRVYQAATSRSRRLWCKPCTGRLLEHQWKAFAISVFVVCANRMPFGLTVDPPSFDASLWCTVALCSVISCWTQDQRLLIRETMHSYTLFVMLIWAVFSQGSLRDWKSWKMKMVMEQSWNMIHWPKVMEFCNKSWNLTNFAPEFDQICTFFLNLEKFTINLESLRFPTLSTKCHIFKIWAEMVMENQEIFMENIFCKVYGNPVIPATRCCCCQWSLLSAGVW